MKATIKKILAIAGATMMIALTMTVNAQNYKAAKIDASGSFIDGNGVNIGKVTKDGVADDKGTKVAYIDSQGNLVDAKTGKKLGKAQKNGDFSYQFPETSDTKNLTVGPPSNGMCEVKDENGNVLLLIHENYKAQAACAYHCARMKSEGKDMKMK